MLLFFHISFSIPAISYHAWIVIRHSKKHFSKSILFPILYKTNLFLRKKIKLITCGTWFGRSGKGRSNARQCSTKKRPTLFELLLRESVQIRGPELKARKLKPADWFRRSLHEWSSPRNKSKNKWKSTTEALPRKFNWKKNSTENSAEKNPKENSKFNELWNFSIKQKKKRKILKFKELCFLDTLSVKFPANCTKICNTLSFYPFLSRFFCIKFLFKNFIVCVIFSNQYPN